MRISLKEGEAERWIDIVHEGNDTGRGRGIVIATDTHRDFPSIWLMLRILKEVGCSLPVQIWQRDNEGLTPEMREMIKGIDGEVVTMANESEHDVDRQLRLWKLRVTAILSSPFNDVLTLSPQVLPIKDITMLFEGPFDSCGALFWPAFREPLPRKVVFDALGLEWRLVPEVDGDVFMIRKERCAVNLRFAELLVSHPFARRALWGNLADGLQFAWRKLGMEFAAITSRPHPLYGFGGPQRNQILSMCHNDYSGERIFQSRSRFPWLLEDNLPISGAIHEPLCSEYLKELRGRLGKNPSLKPTTVTSGTFHEETPEFKELVETTWLLEWALKKWRVNRRVGKVRESTRIEEDDDASLTGGANWTEIRFRRNGTIQAPVASSFRFWQLLEEEEILCLSDADLKPVLHLRRCSEGNWQGSWTNFRGNGRMISVQNAYPATIFEKSATKEAGARPLVVDADADELGKPPNIKDTIHVFHSSDGGLNYISVLYACVAAANVGGEVVFHTKYASLLSRVQHPGLTITNRRLPTRPTIGRSFEGQVFQRIANRAKLVNLSRSGWQRERYAVDRGTWYRKMLGEALEFVEPQVVDRTLNVRRFDFPYYALLFPFSEIGFLEWPSGHWARLVFLLRRRGYEVVAVGEEVDKQRFEAAFASSNIFWTLAPSADWIQDAVLGASVVVGADSEWMQLAILLGAKTVTLNAAFPPKFSFPFGESKHLVAETECRFCRLQAERGYTTSCETMCSALATISPEDVARECERVPY